MIQKLKVEVGVNTIAKISTMFNDIQLGKEINKNF